MTEIPLFPLGSTLFPAGVLHLRIFEVRYLDMVKRCIAEGSSFGVVALYAGGEVRAPHGGEVLSPAGTLACITQWEAPAPTLYQLTCTGSTRFRLLRSWQAKYGLWMGEVAWLPDDPVEEIPAELQPSADALGRLIAGMQQQGVPSAQMPLAPPFRLDECAWVANRWCELLPLPATEQVHLLELSDPVERLRAVHALLSGMLPPQA
ncbi:MAG TPA: LON peptidase substrate-binding domain-containing protein [Bordetella sp.]